MNLNTINGRIDIGQLNLGLKLVCNNQRFCLNTFLMGIYSTFFAVA